MASSSLRALRELRQNFLDSSSALTKDYWSNRALLELYDQTLGFRNQWKWSAILAELDLRAVKFLGRSVLDWGCGSGAAAHAFADAFHNESIEYTLHDRSQLALDFAHEKLEALVKGRTSSQIRTMRQWDSTQRFDVVLLSHVHNELAAATNIDLLNTILKQSDSFIWVEGGTPEASRSLAHIRERARAQGFDALAPCTHNRSCPLAEGTPTDWCHRFAWAPQHTHHDSQWAHRCRDLGIDSRRVAFSFLVMRRQGTQVWSPGLARLNARIIGEPRSYKGYAQLELCRNGQVFKHRAQKRDDANLYRQTQDFSKTLSKLPEINVEDP